MACANAKNHLHSSAQAGGDWELFGSCTDVNSQPCGRCIVLGVSRSEMHARASLNTLFASKGWCGVVGVCAWGCWGCWGCWSYLLGLLRSLEFAVRVVRVDMTELFF